jgi:hypothetical protein
MVGALTHYVLDSTVHPYVFYRSGFDTHGQLTGRYGYDHARLEVAMDLAFIDHFQLPTDVYQPQHTLGLPALDVERISQLYQRAYPQTLTHDTFTLAVEDMKASYRFLYHAGWMRRLLIELVSGRHGLAKALIHPQTQSNDWSSRVLNLDHQPWRHPVSDIESRASCLELIEEAHKKMEAVIEWIASASAKIDASFVDMDYDGKPFKTTLQHFQSYFL